MSEGLEGCRMLMEHPEQLPQDSCQQGVFMEVCVGGGHPRTAGWLPCRTEGAAELESMAFPKEI